MVANPDLFISPEEYLEIDSKNDRPSEYLNGRMVELEGSTENHSQILTNLVTAIVTSLRTRNSSCRAHSQALRVHMPKTGLYAYPDFVMVCGERAFDAYDTLLNPILIVESLSPSTQSYDRGDKFASYRSIPSLQERPPPLRNLPVRYLPRHPIRGLTANAIFSSPLIISST
jgi:Uma2 family endonuclease